MPQNLIAGLFVFILIKTLLMILYNLHFLFLIQYYIDAD